MKYGFLALFALLAACGRDDAPGTAEPGTGSAADRVFLNGSVYTVDAERTWAEAVAVRDGVISAVGTNARIEKYIGRHTDVVDLAGNFLLPGLHDSHTHLSSKAIPRQMPPLSIRA